MQRFPARFAEMDMYVKGGISYPLHKIGLHIQKGGGVAGLAGVFVQKPLKEYMMCSLYAFVALFTFSSVEFFFCKIIGFLYHCFEILKGLIRGI